MAVVRMDNMGVVVDDLDSTIEFFLALGLELEGRATVEGEWAGRVTGLGDQQVEIAMMRTPDGHSRLVLADLFHYRCSRWNDVDSDQPTLLRTDGGQAGSDHRGW